MAEEWQWLARDLSSEINILSSCRVPQRVEIFPPFQRPVLSFWLLPFYLIFSLRFRSLLLRSIVLDNRHRHFRSSSRVSVLFEDNLCVHLARELRIRTHWAGGLGICDHIRDDRTLFRHRPSPQAFLGQKVSASNLGHSGRSLQYPQILRARTKGEITKPNFSRLSGCNERSKELLYFLRLIPRTTWKT